MKIAIEAQRIFRTNKHGMDFVALESIRELQKIDHENEYFIFVTPGEDRCLEESENVHIIELKCPTYPLWEQVALPRAVKKNHARFIALHKQYCPIAMSRTINTNTTRHYLFRKASFFQLHLVSGNGMVLPPDGSTTRIGQLRENYYSLAI